MRKLQIKIAPDHIDDMDFVAETLARKLRTDVNELPDWRILKRSVDARGKQPVYVLSIGLGQLPTAPSFNWQDVTKSKTVHIIGSGPAGYFAALRLIEYGMKPVVFERGKDVQTRRRDLRGLQQYGIVHPDSNYCFGEGGAGTYSDGKLYTRSVKRGRIEDILRLLVDHGASSDILIDAHPHIGSNKLPGIVASLRKTIEAYGGEVHFNTKVTDIEIDKGKVVAVVVNDHQRIEVERLILATGHSARSIYELFDSKSWRLEFKPFALGVRIEHPQPLIDEIQYGKKGRGDHLPAASYRLACQIDLKGVFSFCMCPGGLIVPAATAPGELVVNGMSLSRRDSAFANAGTVVQVEDADLKRLGFEGTLRGLDFQRQIEQRFWTQGDGSQKAPAQRLTDFANAKLSSTLPASSYIPGTYADRIDTLLPDYVASKLRSAVKVFGNKMKGYYTEEAQVIGLESRTSAPIRIPREETTGMHPDVKGLFPCGEGAGFAGGILSAAIDGRNVAEMVAASVNFKK